MNWRIKNWAFGQLAVFHEHKDLLVFISHIDNICPLCFEKEPDKIKFQEKLLGGNFYTPASMNIVNDKYQIAIIPYTQFYNVQTHMTLIRGDKVFEQTVKDLIKEFKGVDITYIVYSL